MTATQWIEQLNLAPHPEGGHYREFYRSPVSVMANVGQRSAVTIIHFLLKASDHSRWHVVESDEIWRHSAGAPLELLVFDPKTGTLTIQMLGAMNDTNNEGIQLTHVVPAGHWQAARPLGDFSLVECTVAPGFDFVDFRMVADVEGHIEHFKNELEAYCSLL